MERINFKKEVFKRDKNKCVVCGETAIDAHHIIDRSLFEDGGYQLDNGVSLCTLHHIESEQTKISCKELRKQANINNIILPEHFDIEEEYDHWGNIVKPNGIRLKGELFFNENVQKAIKNYLHLFVPYVKYSRTYHLSTSPGLQNKDKQHREESFFIGKDIVGTIKMDGENTNMYPDYVHARSTEYVRHESRSWVKSLHAQICHDIPKDYRICGENLYAMHSIHYKNLKSYFYVFSIWNEKNEALSWDETVTYCQLFGLEHVPVFYRGIWDPDKINFAFNSFCDKSKDPVEGYVLRIAESIPMSKFRKSTAKWVRKGHVQTDEFWLNQPLIPNILGENSV